MILVQKQPLSPSPIYALRTHPPPQTLQMLPTRTPGLFTLSKPPLKRNPLPKSKVRASLPAEITDIKKSGAPSPQRRGVKHSKDRVQNQRSNPPSPSPPSRKSAKHKQHSEAIPVPVTPRRQSLRSDPPPPHIHRRPHPTSTFHHLPIRDDINDPADLSTPSNTHRDHHNNLQTAPICSRKPGAFPFNTTSLPSSPSTLPNKRKHRRTQSDGVFHMSSDEDLSSGPDGTSLNPNVQAVFGLTANTFKPSSKKLPPSTPIRAIPPFKKVSGSLQTKREASEKAAGYFASSMFQNSPSPEELPDPPIF